MNLQFKKIPAETGAMEIVRREMPQVGAHLTGTNPVIMTNENGVCYRTHGEVCHIREHLLKLAGSLS